MARRTTEIATRMALGATRSRVAAPILRDALTIASLGVALVALGLPAALALTRLVQSQLYGVAPNDPISFVGAVLALLLVAVLGANSYRHSEKLISRATSKHTRRKPLKIKDVMLVLVLVLVLVLNSEMCLPSSGAFGA